MKIVALNINNIKKSLVLDSLFIVFYTIVIPFSSLSSQEVIATQGGLARSTNVNFSFTVGESCITTLYGTKIILTQGFHQPKILIVKNLNVDTRLTFSVYPNPSSDNIRIIFEEDGLNFSIFDINGRDVDFKNLLTTKNSVDISLGHLPAGSYLLRAQDYTGKSVGMIHIMKQ